MPTSLSLKDLRRGKLPPPRSHISSNEHYFQQHQQFFENFDDEFLEENIVVEDLVNENGEDANKNYPEDANGEVEGMQMHGIQNIPINDHYGLDIGSEQIVVESVNVQEGEPIPSKHNVTVKSLTEVQLSKQEHKPRHKQDYMQISINQQEDDRIEQHENIDRQGEEAGEILSSGDLPICRHSQMGVYEFTTEFLALSRKHRLQPKARAILLDLFQRTLPQENRCPSTLSDMRKMMALDNQTHWLGTTQGASLPSSSKITIQTILPQTHYLIPASNMQSTSRQRISNKPIRTFINQPQCSPLASRHIPRYQTGEEEYVEEEIVNDQLLYYPQPDELPNDMQILLPQIFQTINNLSEEVAYLRAQLETRSPEYSSFGTVRKLKKRIHDGRFGLHIYDEHEQKVLLSELGNDELKNTIELSRADENRLIYGSNDITDLVLEKIDLTPYIHNPSLCGRMVADVLYSPEYLADKHILGEGQVSSRTRLECLPQEMTHLFYDSLRKLGVSRIADEDKEHWLYLARDGVNQRARDLKANRKRKFYIDEQPAVFRDEEEHL